MTRTNEKVDAELENIERALSILPAENKLSNGNLTPLETAGVGAVLHDIYNGLENVLKQLIRHRGRAIPDGDAWHRELLGLAVELKILSENTADQPKPYLAFRHFFVHGYSLELDLDRLRPLIQDAKTVVDAFRSDIRKAC